jgi:two-component system chemotaxis sensor kinase CheA
MIDLSLLQDFIAEAGEHLEGMETDLIQLEANPDNKEILNDIFRAIHTIKGSSEYLGLKKIAELSHTLENLLEMLRKGEKLPDGKLIDTLIGARDRIARLISDLETSRSEETEIKDVIEQIQSLSMNSDEKPPENKPEKDGTERKSNDKAGAEDLDFSRSLENKDDSITSEGCDDEIYEEENDEELLEIFIQRLTDLLSLLKIQTAQLGTSSKSQEILDKSFETIRALKSSANYMGYEELIRLYDRWCADIETAKAKLSEGGQVSFTFMTSYVDEILKHFPKIKFSEVGCGDDPLLDAENERTVHIPQEEFTLFQDEEREGEINGISNESSLEDDSSFLGPIEEKLSERDKSDDNELFEKLGKAFDLNMTENNEGYPELFQEKIEEELFSKRLTVTADQKALKIDAEKHLNGRDFQLDFDSEDKKRNLQKEEIRFKKPESSGSTGLPVRKTMRVDADKIDSLMNQVGELVVSRAWFLQLFNEMRQLQQYLKETAKLEQKEMKQVRNLTFKLSEATTALGRVANEMQEGVMKVRMLPIAHLFNRYPRLVRDLVRDTNKQVDLEIKGLETELDKMIIEELSDPLLHIVRNAVDHGIETIERRRRMGKTEKGKITLNAYHESNHVVIEIIDDGKGIDPEFLKITALEKKFLPKEELDRMASKDLIELIMRPGFSTASQVTHTSGRGVGMDVVKKNIEKLNGTIEIDSKVSVETRFRIKIPLTLAIIPALLVRVGKDIFTIPLATVEETLRIFEKEISIIEDIEVINLRDSTLPLIRLPELFNAATSELNAGKLFVVVVSTGMRRVGLVVDALIGQEEVVIKPLADYLQENSGFSGATILGDGHISLILDIYELVNLYIEGHTKRKFAAAI